MADVQESENGQPPARVTAGELRAGWDHFRSGETVPCPLDGAPLALAVDGAYGIYRFVCTQCGASSAWFESGPNGLQVRAPAPDPLANEGPRT